jgi:hypothetical protein
LKCVAIIRGGINEVNSAYHIAGNAALLLRNCKTCVTVWISRSIENQPYISKMFGAVGIGKLKRKSQAICGGVLEYNCARARENYAIAAACGIDRDGSASSTSRASLICGVEE